jgi:hypothetical protein
MGNWIFIAIGVVCLIIPLIMAIAKIIKIQTSDRITFIQGDKRITISSTNLSAEDRKKLVNF